MHKVGDLVMSMKNLGIIRKVLRHKNQKYNLYLIDWVDKDDTSQYNETLVRVFKKNLSIYKSQYEQA